MSNFEQDNSSVKESKVSFKLQCPKCSGSLYYNLEVPNIADCFKKELLDQKGINISDNLNQAFEYSDGDICLVCLFSGLYSDPETIQEKIAHLPKALQSELQLISGISSKIISKKMCSFDSEIQNLLQDAAKFHEQIRERVGNSADSFLNSEDVDQTIEEFNPIILNLINSIYSGFRSKKEEDHCEQLSCEKEDHCEQLSCEKEEDHCEQLSCEKEEEDRELEEAISQMRKEKEKEKGEDYCEELTYEKEEKGKEKEPQWKNDFSSLLSSFQGMYNQVLSNIQQNDANIASITQSFQDLEKPRAEFINSLQNLTTNLFEKDHESFS